MYPSRDLNVIWRSLANKSAIGTEFLYSCFFPRFLVCITGSMLMVGNVTLWIWAAMKFSNVSYGRKFLNTYGLYLSTMLFEKNPFGNVNKKLLLRELIIMINFFY